ncbi:MAG TPA: hypothetical protein VNW90_15045 [Acetobacteraceae bacterium]|nr:hypothetical protein [Acetobacteraceae bacterium]
MTTTAWSGQQRLFESSYQEPEMRRFLLGVLFLILVGAVLGAVSTWPKPENDPARTSPTLAEFQRGVGISQPSDTMKQSPPILAARSELPWHDATIVAALSAHAVSEASNQLDPDWYTSGKTYRVASTQPLLQLLSAGENVPEAGLAQLPKSQTTPDVPRQEEQPTEAVPLPTTESAQAATLAVVSTPEPNQPTKSTNPAAIPDTPLPDNRSTASPALAVATAEPRAQTSDSPATSASFQTLMAGHHVEHVSIHYHTDSRSLADAQRISSRLGSAGMSKAEMHTTAHTIPAPLVRYFSRQDAPAAVSLAKALGSKPTDWRADDCTAYRHKPDRGTIELWPVTAGTTPLAAH